MDKPGLPCAFSERMHAELFFSNRWTNIRNRKNATVRNECTVMFREVGFVRKMLEK